MSEIDPNPASLATLTRIAEALERIAPPPLPPADLGSHAAYRWNGGAIEVIHDFEAPDYDLLTGIDAQKAACLENTRRLSQRLPAHDVLLWGARGTGKSATVAAAIGRVRAEGGAIGLVDFASSDLHSLPALLGQLRAADRPFVIFLDDLGFDENFAGDARALRSILQGGATARGGLVRLYATANRRHIVARSLAENDPVNPRDVADDKLALADRFALPFDAAEAVQWSTQRGSRSGRVAWQYIIELAGKVSVTLTH